MKNALEMLRTETRELRRVVAHSLYRSPALERGAIWSYSVFGEDRVALGWLLESGVQIEDIRYLDIGASDPVALSNTMLMYQHGAKGVLVEPDMEMAKKLRARRVRDLVIDAAVAFDERRSGMLIRFSSSVFNTFSETQAEEVVRYTAKSDSRQAVLGRIEVELVPINDIIERHLGGVAPHFLSIDVESVDFEILRSLDFGRFRPWIICVEKFRGPSEFGALLVPRGYRVICETPHNLMFMLDPQPAVGGTERR